MINFTQPETALNGSRVCSTLISRGELNADDRDRIEALARESGRSVGATLLRSGLVAETVLADAYAEALRLPRLTGDREPVPHPALSSRFLTETRIVPLADDPETLVLAVFDPEDAFTLAAIELASGKPLDLRIATASQITSLLALLAPDEVLLQSTEATIDSLAHADTDPQAIDRLRDLAGDAPIVRAVQDLIERAITNRASDIHIEPFGTRLQIRLRIDGVLHPVHPAPPAVAAAAISSRIKLLAGLDIAERRLPQDGRIQLPIHGRVIDFRVSTVPTLHAESIVVRILDRATLPLDFTALGFAAPLQRALQDAAAKPHGIILVTGPTGSGKTTTLYAALQLQNTTARKILTVEDPIEYQIDGVNQIPIRPAIGLHFADALRSVLRQDPDVILVGEMRDGETARIAIQAALTGHLVLSTLHTNDAAGAITRLLDMGIEPYLVTSTVTGILAQRLVRRLCPACKVPLEVARDIFLANGLVPPEIMFAAQGCDACSWTGYRGRLGIGQWLALDDPIRVAILRHADSAEIARIAQDAGMSTLRADGLRTVALGQTAIDEVLRVSG